MAARKPAANKKAKAPADIKRVLSDLRWALAGWDGDVLDKDDSNYADVTLRPSEVRRMWAAIDKYGA